MVKLYTHAFPHQSWSSAYDFLKDALSLTSDINFEEHVKIIKIEKNGYVLDFCIDGDLFCYIKIKPPNGPMQTHCWQGISQYENVSVSAFIKNLEDKLDIECKKSLS